MKLNNLSRLAALLVAIMMLGVTSASAAIDFSDLTGSDLSSTDQIAAMVEAGYCAYCSEEIVSNGLAWPVDGFTCLYQHLASMDASSAYDMLNGYYTAGTDEGDAYYEAYFWSHQRHVDDGAQSAVICYGFDCTSFPLKQPGAEYHTDTECPWHDEEYTPSVTTDPDVSTPDALEGIAEVVLSFTATDATTYTWQRSTTPDVTDSWADIDGATENTYTLALTPEALTYAYRCVATDADDNVVSTSAALYLGGETFFAWVNSTDIYTWVTATDLAKTQTVEYILAAYAASADGIALAEAIYVADGEVENTYILLELLGLTTLADIDDAGNVTDTRYHIVVATYNATTDTITALTTSDTTATD